MKSDDSDPLRPLLREWSATPPTDPALAERVSRALATAPRATPAFSWRVAVAALAIGGLAGLGLPAVIDARHEAARRMEMPANYLAWIAPHVASRPAGQ